MADDAIIPDTPSEAEYETAEEAFGVAEDQGELLTSDDPVHLFITWFALARKHEPNDANAMSLATVDASGMPNVRIVLLKDISTEGFSFYSNAESTKGQELTSNPQAALCFHWKTIRRQVRVRGPVSVLDDEASDAYFASRARGAQIGAWASFQSRELESREMLTRRIEDYEAIYKDRKVPRPDNWQGWIIRPQEIEFWVNRPYRLHDRLKFEERAEGWHPSRLYP